MPRLCQRTSDLASPNLPLRTHNRSPSSKKLDRFALAGSERRCLPGSSWLWTDLDCHDRPRLGRSRHRQARCKSPRRSCSTHGSAGMPALPLEIHAPASARGLARVCWCLSRRPATAHGTTCASSSVSDRSCFRRRSGCCHRRNSRRRFSDTLRVGSLDRRRAKAGRPAVHSRDNLGSMQRRAPSSSPATARSPRKMELWECRMSPTAHGPQLQRWRRRADPPRRVRGSDSDT